jgi:tetratricopeptide (TPR) repeat protein
MNNPFIGMTVAEKYATISFTLWKYLQLSIFPHPLSHDYYPYAIPILNWADPRAYVSALIYIILVILSFWIIKKRKKAGYGLLFFLIPLSIVSNIVINIGTFMNERFLFISSLGVCLLIAWNVLYIARKKGSAGRVIAGIIVFFIMSGFTYKTINRVPDWENALSLNRSAIESNPGSARANSFMSTALYNEWRTQNKSEEKRRAMEEAMLYAEKATAMLPNYKNAQLMKAGIAAELYKFDNNTELLLKHFAEVATYRPDVGFIFQFISYLRGKVPEKVLVDFYYNTGYKILFLNQRNPGWAIRYLLQGLEISPGNRKIIQGLAEVYETLGDVKNAEKYFNLLIQK